MLADALETNWVWSSQGGWFFTDLCKIPLECTKLSVMVLKNFKGLCSWLHAQTSLVRKKTSNYMSSFAIIIIANEILINKQPWLYKFGFSVKENRITLSYEWFQYTSKTGLYMSITLPEELPCFTNFALHIFINMG